MSRRPRRGRQDDRGAGLFQASHRSRFWDSIGIPYDVSATPAAVRAGLPERHPLRSCAWLRTEAQDADRSLWWPRVAAGGNGSEPGLRAGMFRLGEIPLFGRVLPDAVVEDWWSDTGSGWMRSEAVVDRDGARVASLWRDQAGSMLLPFDPDELVTNYLSEAYRSFGQRRAFTETVGVARRAYYRARPLLPRAAQLQFRRLLARVQSRMRFPRWPVEPALHDLSRLLLGSVATLAQAPVPWIAAWPQGCSWAVVLTHDVETARGYANLNLLRDVESAAGLRSSWNFVPERYPVADALVDDLLNNGFEVGVHGLRHDGRDLESLATLTARLPAIRASAERWRAVGFRSPATQRCWEWMPMLGFDYDSSYPDNDPFEPQAGGCCSSLPYFNQELVELPITLLQDHTMFEILGHSDERAWVEKAEWLRQAGGMALLITHPDYMLVPDRLAVYARFLDYATVDSSAWHALPRDVSAWWRRRAGSHLVLVGGEWRVTGAAANDAAISFAAPP